MKKKRVAIFLPELYYDGIETLYRNLSRFWNYEKFEFTYFITAPQKFPTEDEVISNGVKTIHLPVSTSKNIFFYWKIVYNALKRQAPFDAVHANNDFINSQILFAAQIMGVPQRISHVHSSCDIKKHRTLHFIYAFFSKKLLRKSANYFLAPSLESGSYFYGDQPFDLIMQGINLNLFLNLNNNNKRTSNLRSNSPRFITVASLIPLKNPLFLLDVFCELLKIKPNSTLTWIGSGPMQDQIRRIAAQRGVENSVHLLGNRKDVDALMKNHDYFIFPSISEGLGLALLEAQASGLDCFISDGIPKMANCGKCLEISLNLSASEWAKTIVDFINSGQNLEIDTDKLLEFDIRRMGNELMQLYESC